MKPLPVNTEPLNVSSNHYFSWNGTDDTDLMILHCQVVMRVRPMNNREYKDGAKTIVRPADDKVNTRAVDDAARIMAS